MSKNIISLFVVDDHPLFRQGVCAIVASHAEIEVVGQSDGGNGTVDAITAAKPDIVLLDLSLPGDRGLRMISEIRTAVPHCRVVALSMTTALATVRAAIAEGASSVITKGASSSDIVKAVTRVHDGEWYFSRDVTDRLLERLVSDPTPEPAALGDERYGSLTPREREVLLLLAEAKSPKEIAYSLDIARSTVDVHKTNLMRKMGFHDMTDLFRFAMKAGFIDAAEWLPADSRKR